MAVIDFDISHIVLHLIRLKLLFLLFHVIYVLLLKRPNPFLFHIWLLSMIFVPSFPSIKNNINSNKEKREPPRHSTFLCDLTGLDITELVLISSIYPYWNRYGQTEAETRSLCIIKLKPVVPAEGDTETPSETRSLFTFSSLVWLVQDPQPVIWTLILGIQPFIWKIY